LPCKKIEIIGIANFSVILFLELILIWILGAKKCSRPIAKSLDSSNFNHSRTTFPLITSHFFAHYFGTCIMMLLVPTLKRRKKHIPNFDWKFVLTLVGLQVEYGSMVKNGWSYLTFLIGLVWEYSLHTRLWIFVQVYKLKSTLVLIFNGQTTSMSHLTTGKLPIQWVLPSHRLLHTYSIVII